jgi:hypothetical protein
MFKIKIKTGIKIMGDTKIGHEVENQIKGQPFQGEKKNHYVKTHIPLEITINETITESILIKHFFQG